MNACLQRRAPGVLPLLCALSLQAAAIPEPTQQVFHHENVLGTSFELKVRSTEAAAARQAESVALAEIDRLARIFSHYSPDTEFSRWQATHGRPVPVSPELFEVLAAAEHWQDASGGAFNPAVEAFTRIWKNAATRDVLPAAGELAGIAPEVARRAWRLDPAARTAEHLTTVPLSLNAIAKGYIIERASALAAAQPGVQGVLLEIGGDLRVRGRFTEQVAITDPRHDEENSPPLGTVPVYEAGLATSGGYRRGVQVRGRAFSHLIDPRTGEPARQVAGATVLAPDAATADALSTTLSILTPEEGLKLADETPGVACLLVLEDGRRRPSSRWPATPFAAQPAADGPSAGPGRAPAAPAASAPAELSLDFEINHPEGGRYLRPYVAAWIEDKDGFPVRTVLLWLLQSEKGARWIPDLRRWHRGDQIRRLAEDQDLVATVSGATRNPGRYKAVWDGKDDHGTPVKPGTYTFHLEAAREHGTYQLMKHEFSVGGDPFRVELKGNEEIKGATLEYRRRSPGP